MKILAIDTTAPTSSVALWENGRLLAMDTVNSSLSHSVTLLPMIDSCLSALGLTVDDMDALACSAGPGSFTGVRIGVSTLKGLAFKRDLPAVGVSTLEALSLNLCGFEGVVAPVMNARRGQVYTAMFELDGSGKAHRLTKDDALPLTTLGDMLEKTGKPVCFTGDGYDLAKETISISTVRETPEILRYQNAAHVAAVAEQKLLSVPASEWKQTFSAAVLSPVYLRKPQAEREREERLLAEQKEREGGCNEL